MPTDLRCDAALRFAARDYPEITVPAERVDDYLERWTRVVTREPVLDGRAPQTYRNARWTDIEVRTSDATLQAAWSAGSIKAGVPAFDAAIDALTAPTLSYLGDGYILMTVGGIYSEAALDRELRLGGARLNDPVVLPADDGAWAWDGDTARIDFTFGWGDCFVQCTGFRSLRAIVPPEGVATVYDLGGDPLPAGLALAPTTLPP